MIYPSVADLVKKTGSRYALVIATAKRAREIASGETPLTECSSSKPVTIALNEINDGVVEVFDRDSKPKKEINDFSELPEIMVGNTEE